MASKKVTPGGAAHAGDVTDLGSSPPPSSVIGNIVTAANKAANSPGAVNNQANPGQPSRPPVTTPTDPYGGYGAAAGPDYAAELAEKRRQFDITTARDIAKQNASEVDSLQGRLASLSGPKDAYADYFFSHGLMPPQGYKPAPVPLTQAQTDAYGKLGVNPQQLQQMLGGTGQPGANTGMLGSLGSSLQTPAGLPQFEKAPDITQAQTPSNPTMQGGALYGKTPTATPGGVPSMAGGGQVPGQPGTPSLAVVHGGETVTPAGQQPPPPGGAQPGAPQDQGALMSNPGLHPAIAQLVDAVSALLSNPDFKPFVAASQGNQQGTPGGVPSMAMGGIVPDPATQPPSTPQAPSNPPPAMNSGVQSAGAYAPQPSGPAVGGAQGVISNTGAAPTDNPVMPTSNMDPYTRALYDIHGRLHPYSAQQELQMGPQGLDAVASYVGKVQGGDVKAYQNLADRLKPQAGAPSGSNSTSSEGFSFG